MELRIALKPLQRFVATVAHSKHRFFVWLPVTTSPDQALITVARSDDTTFGLLHSRLHELWSLRMGTSLEDRPRYTPTTTFETFPFPEGLTPADTLGAGASRPRRGQDGPAPGLTPADTLGAGDSRDGGGSPGGRSLRPWDTGHPWPKAASGTAAEGAAPTAWPAAPCRSEETPAKCIANKPGSIWIPGWWAF